MDLFLQLLGTIGICFGGFACIAFGALGNAVPVFMAGYAIFIVGATLFMNKLWIVMGAPDTNNVFIMSIFAGVGVMGYVHYRLFVRRVKNVRKRRKQAEPEIDPWRKN